MKTIKAAFFDRDGTLIRDVSYLSNLDLIVLIPQAVVLCRQLMQAGYTLIVVTNQSGVARGYFDEDFVQRTHERLAGLLSKQGVAIKKFYYCPHHPTEAARDEYRTVCDCRKPQPGLLQSAAREFNIDLSRSLMFGDSTSDIAAGEAAGCRSFYIQDIMAQQEDELARLENFIQKGI